MKTIKYIFTFEKRHKTEQYFTPRKEITFFKYDDYFDFGEYLEVFNEFLGRELDTESKEDMALYNEIFDKIKGGKYFQQENYMSFTRLTLFIITTGGEDKINE
jgi:hypothetical protein